MTEEDAALVGVGTASVPVGYVNKKDPWIDRVHNGVFNTVWRSAMTVDQWFGSTASDVGLSANQRFHRTRAALR